MTQLENARNNIITNEMKQAALREGVDTHYIRSAIAEGTVIITKNKNHKSIEPLAIGKGLSTKVNANIGTSQDRVSLREELEKLHIAVKAGADAVMDLSTGGQVDEIRRVLP